ncbi:MAG TPA: hypothetical protein VK135_00565 [Candidatus Dormibacteraeota bacterium]|nr:hypothetical protein [Candidatus Dormibacteraeota bacterium]
MKKTLLTIISFFVLIGMVACASNDNNPNNNSQNDVNDQPSTSETQSPDDNNENAVNNQTDDNEENVEDDQGNDIPESLADFEETQTLSEQIDLNALDPEIETDNQNNRVIIFSDDSHTKKYKSIFIKKQNRLKIISLDDDGQIFNEVID